MQNNEPAVLVVGAGLAGLSSAVFLATHGVPVRVVEARTGSLVHPRARTVNPRTAELLRQVGLEEPVLGARSYMRALPSVYRIRAHTLAGPELHRVEQRPPRSADGAVEVSCCQWGAIDQDRLEGILLDKARELGAVVDFGVRLVGLTQDDGGVTATLGEPGGATVTQRVDYLIGADGTNSAVRRLVGVTRRGPGTLSHQLSMVFRADLTAAMRGRHDPANNTFVAVAHLGAPREGTVLSPYGTDKWVFYTPYDPDRDGSAATFDDVRCAELIRAAVGVDDLDVTLVPQLADGTKVLGYEVAAAVAEKFRVGRVFLAGDSAHAVPPAGAFGAGLCFQDAHNLAWKLGMVHSGQAEPGLLDSYEQERLAAARFTLGQALAQTRVFNDTAPVPGEATLVEYDTVVFGYRYHSAAVVSDGGDETVPASELSGQPGTRAPHVALDGARSTLDWYGPALVLVTGPDADGFRRAAGGLTTVTLDPQAATAHGVTETGALLVRPDGVVAWRAPAGVADPEAVLTAVLDQVLGRVRVLQSAGQPTGGQ